MDACDNLENEAWCAPVAGPPVPPGRSARAPWGVPHARPSRPRLVWHDPSWQVWVIRERVVGHGKMGRVLRSVHDRLDMP